MEVDKNILINDYGIDDENFEQYLNKFNTLTKIINLSHLSLVPKEKVRELYNRFLYYFSLGHSIHTISIETIPVVKKLFFLNGDGSLKYTVTPDDRMKNSYTYVNIEDRVCQVKITFDTAKEIKPMELILQSIPAPIQTFRDIIITSGGIKTITVNEKGLLFPNDTIPINTKVEGVLTYLIGK